MKLTKRALLGGAILAGLAAAATVAAAQPSSKNPVKIGEINSYSTMPQFTQPYRQGWQLAVEEVNVAGGLLGRASAHRRILRKSSTHSDLAPCEWALSHFR